jgi:hypothetical protein
MHGAKLKKKLYLLLDNLSVFVKSLIDGKNEHHLFKPHCPDTNAPNNLFL